MTKKQQTDEMFKFKSLGQKSYGCTFLPDISTAPVTPFRRSPNPADGFNVRWSKSVLIVEHQECGSRSTTGNVFGCNYKLQSWSSPRRIIVVLSILHHVKCYNRSMNYKPDKKIRTSNIFESTKKSYFKNKQLYYFDERIRKAKINHQSGRNINEKNLTFR